MTDQEAAVWAAVYTMRLKKLHARAGRTQESWGEDRVQARIAATYAVYGFRKAAEEIAAADLARPDQTHEDAAADQAALAADDEAKP